METHWKKEFRVSVCEGGGENREEKGGACLAHPHKYSVVKFSLHNSS